MSCRNCAAIGALIAVMAIVALELSGDAQQAASLRTPWDDPDLQGIWDHKITTPLERPAKFADREFLTDEEVAALDKVSTASPVGRGRDVRAERGSEADVEGAYNNIFSTGGGRYLRSKRTSLLIDPPDGKLPPLTLEGQKLLAARTSNRFGTPTEDGDVPDRRNAGRRGNAAPPAGRGNDGAARRLARAEGGLT